MDDGCVTGSSWTRCDTADGIGRMVTARSGTLGNPVGVGGARADRGQGKVRSFASAGASHEISRAQVGLP